MSDEIEIKEKTIEHPMEDVLDIESGSTIVEYKERNTELVEIADYDEKDNEIENQFQEVYDVAMDAFDAQSEAAEVVDPKYSARNAEVAAQYLNAALNAVKEKSSMKQHKDKIKKAEAGATGANGNGSTINTQNNIIVDRNDLLKQILATETEPKDITPDET